jgi:hypothetical protein
MASQEREMLEHLKARPRHHMDFHIYFAGPTYRSDYLSAHPPIRSRLSQRKMIALRKQVRLLADGTLLFTNKTCNYRYDGIMVCFWPTC